MSGCEGNILKYIRTQFFPYNYTIVFCLKYDEFYYSLISITIMSSVSTKYLHTTLIRNGLNFKIECLHSKEEHKRKYICCLKSHDMAKMLWKCLFDYNVRIIVHKKKELIKYESEDILPTNVCSTQKRTFYKCHTVIVT